ncbi:MAG: lipopolysaccharide transport periplasmic protein LptA [Gallionellaceae bacterium]|nr:lipopolysaccharide transport periplasmic protein LptA [Gallionellaceae bacterium]
MRLVTSAWLALTLACLVPGAAWAEKADRTRPIQIEADSVHMDEAGRTAIYEGGVAFAQGTLSLSADRIEIHQDERGMAWGVATGRPAHFLQKMEGRDEYLEARAQRIEYDTRTETMKLTGDAYVRQGNDELHGGLIVYDIRSERYQAEGAAEAGGQGRVRAVIRPRTSGATPAQP